MQDDIWALTDAVAGALLVLHLENTSVLEQTSFLEHPLKCTFVR
jgi:hypothetical protein